jgi:two-component system response regulator YesN
MHRLLIVDDMPIIVDDLADMLKEKEELELEIFKAYATDEALRILSEHKIDIVLSDIRMPGMSGLDLLREIRAQWPRCKVIFLTSFHDFHYAKEAISLGSFDYILKTEGDPSIVRSVEKAVDAIREEWKRSDLIERANKQYSQAKPFMQKDLILNLIYGNKLAEHERIKQFESVDMPLSPAAPTFLMVSRIDAWKENLTFNHRQLMNYAVQNVLEEYVESSFSMLNIPYDRTNVVWLIQPKDPGTRSDKEWGRLFRFLYGTLETVQHSCREKLNLKLSFLVGSKPVHWDELSDVFHRLDVRFHSGLALNEEILMTDEESAQSAEEWADLPQHVQSELSRIRHNDYRQMSDLLKSGLKEEFMQLLEGMLKLGRSAGRHVILRLEIYHMLASLYLSVLASRDAAAFELDHADYRRLSQFDAGEPWGTYETFFRSLFHAWFEFKTGEKQESSGKIVLALQEYIRNNLSGDLSLTRLGEHVRLNPSYLSRLYKQMTGMSLTDYISEIRIEAAKELLHTNMKIQDIAEAVGYYSGTAFARFFKKHINMTPQEYRDAIT